MVLPGDISCYYNYTFPNGTKQDKLFITLSKPKDDSPCIFALITSQERHFPGALKGCNLSKKVFLILKDDESVFFEDSYILLDKLFPMEIEKIFSRSQSGVFKEIGKLSSTCLKKILTCLKLFKDDIAVEHWNLIFPKN